jgi:hypothetical protein
MATPSKRVKKDLASGGELKEDLMWNLFFGDRSGPTEVISPYLWIGGMEDGKEKNVLVGS